MGLEEVLAGWKLVTWGWNKERMQGSIAKTDKSRKTSTEKKCMAKLLFENATVRSCKSNT